MYCSEHDICIILNLCKFVIQLSIRKTFSKFHFIRSIIHESERFYIIDLHYLQDLKTTSKQISHTIYLCGEKELLSLKAQPWGTTLRYPEKTLRIINSSDSIQRGGRRLVFGGVRGVGGGSKRGLGYKMGLNGKKGRRAAMGERCNFSI